MEFEDYEDDLIPDIENEYLDDTVEEEMFDQLYECRYGPMIRNIRDSFGRDGLHRLILILDITINEIK